MPFKTKSRILELLLPVGLAGQPSVTKIISVEERFLSAHGLRDSDS